MIIQLKKYKEHGYIKAIWMIVVKIFLTPRHKMARTFPRAVEKKAYTRYPHKALDEEEKWNCISCYLCAEICPTECISISGEKNKESLHSGKAPKAFAVALSNCTQCKLCVDVCPTAALDFNGAYQDEDFVSPINFSLEENMKN